jgi:hypothetical protein
MRVFGYIRFSFFGRNDTKLSRHTTDEIERFNALYDPVRMKERFYFFEKVTMPSIRAQTDPEFQIIVATSNVMPDEYKSRLEEIVADIPQIEILYSDADHISDALNPKIKEMTADITDKTIHFRLDDDDAICAQMVTMLKKSLRRCHPDDLVTFPRGLYLASDGGNSYVLRKFEPYIAIAWALVNGPGQVRNPYHFKHGARYEVGPSYMDPRPYAYIHVAHDSSDTREQQARKLRHALNFDTAHGSERALARTAQIVERRFPSFTMDSLHDIITNAPGRKKRKAKVSVEKPATAASTPSAVDVLSASRAKSSSKAASAGKTTAKAKPAKAKIAKAKTVKAAE